MMLRKSWQPEFERDAEARAFSGAEYLGSPKSLNNLPQSSSCDNMGFKYNTGNQFDHQDGSVMEILEQVEIIKGTPMYKVKITKDNVELPDSGCQTSEDYLDTFTKKISHENAKISK
jgi:hypothetical protein